MTSDLEQAIDYILLTLQKSGGTFNFLHLEGKRFKNESQRFEAIAFLLSHDYIAKVQGSFKLVHKLTDKGNAFIYRNYFNRVLRYLAANDDDFKQVSDILKELSIPDQKDELANAIDIKLRGDKLVFETEESGVMINENGRHLISEQRFGLTAQNQATQITNSGVFIQNSNINHSRFSNMDQCAPWEMPIQQQTEQNKNTSPDKNAKIYKWIINHIIQIILGVIATVIAGYILFRFGWI